MISLRLNMFNWTSYKTYLLNTFPFNAIVFLEIEVKAKILVTSGTLYIPGGQYLFTSQIYRRLIYFVLEDISKCTEDSLRQFEIRQRKHIISQYLVRLIIPS